MSFFKDDKKEQRRIEKMLRKAKRHAHVAVGIVQDKKRKKKKIKRKKSSSGEKKIKGKKSSPVVKKIKKTESNISMIDLAMIHEYGSGDGRIHKRSFIRETCDAKRKDHIRFLKSLEKKVFLGKLTQMKALHQLGLMVKKDIIESINNGLEPGLSETTIKRKKSSKPLIDTSQLKGAISHEVQDGRAS